MKVYNTLTRKKEEIKEKKLKAFVCGITCYDYAHIGHARSYICFDVIIKFLRYLGKDVFYLQNITDIDDKIIERADKSKQPWDSISKEFAKAYLDDMKTLGVDSVDKYVLATKYIKNIKSQVQRLLDIGVAYKLDDGIYFEINKFPDYGKLSHQYQKDMKSGVRVEINKQKKHHGDFVLWKFRKQNEPFWPAKFGSGRPGWHIEDTAITEQEFGPQYDLHGGGLDLIFPHHESEIAQMESISGRAPLVKYWLHNGFVLVDNVKMSKSLGNFWTIRDVLKEFSPRAVRHYCLSVHYHAPINYSKESLQHSENTIKRLDDFVSRVRSANGKISNVKPLIQKTEKAFTSSMENDFDTSGALSSLFGLIHDINKLVDESKLSKKNAQDVISFIKEINTVLGIFRLKEDTLSKNVRTLIKQRETARNNKDFALADKIREKLKGLGIILEDTKEGIRWKKL
ncbi:MAG: cysteine--tRNA ligase [Nanoarchaeota archaeon]